MSTLHKVKAYFGMAPMDDYDDEYYEDDDRSPSRGYSRRPREDRFEDEAYGPDSAPCPVLRGGVAFDRAAPRVSLSPPADIVASAEDRRRIAEAGFYAYQ